MKAFKKICHLIKLSKKYQSNVRVNVRPGLCTAFSPEGCMHSAWVEPETRLLVVDPDL